MDDQKDFLSRLAFRLGLALIAMGLMIYVGATSSNLDQTPVGNAWSSVIVGGAGVVLLAMHFYLNRK